MMNITREGAVLPKSQEIMARVRKDLVVTPFSPQNPFPCSFRVFGERPDTVVVPLHWARDAFPTMTIRDARPAPSPMTAPFNGVLRTDLHQHEAVAQVEQQWKHSGGALLCLPCGYGKTTTALYLACSQRMKTMVLVHKEFLKSQWEERIRYFVPHATVSFVQGDTCDTSGDFVIAMLQTLVSRKYAPSVFEQVGLVVVDEAHHLAATKLSQAMWSLCAQRTLGLTATPDRSDRLGRVVEWFLGGIAFKLKRTCQTGTHVKMVQYSCPRYASSPPTNKRGDICFTSVVSDMVSDAARTELVAKEAADLAKSGRHVLVLSHRRGHCQSIADALRLLGVECGTYLGGDKVVPESQVVVATYALTSEGFDCPRLTALILATPASNVEQACGRVMRGSAAQSAIIVDVVDAWGVCYAQHAKRKAFYKRSGFNFSRNASTTEPDLEDYAFMHT
jgi:hypothetical protein